MFSDLFGPSAHEVAQGLREFTLTSTAQHVALLRLLCEKGILTDEDMERLGLLAIQAHAEMDQLVAQKTDELIREDSPGGERLRAQKKTADFFGSLLGVVDPEKPKDDDDPKSKLH